MSATAGLSLSASSAKTTVVEVRQFARQAWRPQTFLLYGLLCSYVCAFSRLLCYLNRSRKTAQDVCSPEKEPHPAPLT